MSDGGMSLKKRPLHFAVLMLISFVVFLGGMTTEVFLRWPDQWGIFVTMACLIWLVVMLPWSLGVVAIYRWRRWRRFRSCWVLLPVVAIAGYSLVSLILNPPQPETPESRFSRIAEVALPAERVHLKCRLVGGGLIDYDDVYYFETTPNEVDRLIREMKLEQVHDGDGELSPAVGFPDFRGWPGMLYYSRYAEVSSWQYELVTDASRTKVYIRMTCL